MQLILLQMWQQAQDTGVAGRILGIKGVYVKIPAAVYEEVEKIKAGVATGNEELDKIIKSMSEPITDAEAIAAIKEYKVMQSNGTFSKLVDSTDPNSASDVTTSITTTSNYGHYQIAVGGINVIKTEMLGVIIETEGGKKIGLKHLDNLWSQTGAIAFAVKDGFVTHNNAIEYKRFSDMPGDTITKITYLLKDKEDIVISTNLKCKYLLEDGEAVTTEDVAYNAAGTKVQITANGAADSDYRLAEVKSTKGVLELGSDYTYASGQLTLSANCHPGAYTVKFTDDNYDDMSAVFIVNSAIAEDGIKVENNKLSINDKVSTLEEYISQITKIKVNDKEFTGSTVGSAVFGADGTVDFDAKVRQGRSEVVVFAEGSDGEYTVVISASGFPEVTAKLGKQEETETPEKTAQTIRVTSAYTKKYGDVAFALNAAAEGKLSYTSSNANVVTVDANGKVSIKGAGSAIVTVKAAETSTKKNAEAKVTIKVNKAVAAITATAAHTKTYGDKAFDLDAKTTGGTLSYKVSDSKIVAVSATGKVTIKGTGKVTVTVTSAESANYTRAEKKVTITVTPKKVKIVSTKSTSKKKITVQWKKDTKATGYQIKIALNKKFTKGVKTVDVKSAKTIKKTVKGVKSGKKYFVKVRAYKKSGSTKVYGGYSAVKPVKVK